MSQFEKLLEKFINSPQPKWEELERLLKKLDYIKQEGSGSRIKFINKEKDSAIDLHKPHPENTIKTYVKKVVIEKLKQAGFL
jgi:hypothetical protein